MEDESLISAGVGARIREVRMQKKMSQQELAAAAGISLPHISAIEHGKKIMRLITFIKIIEALQVSADYVLRANVPSVNQLYQNELTQLFVDCSPAEVAALKKIVVELKQTMRTQTQEE